MGWEPRLPTELERAASPLAPRLPVLPNTTEDTLGHDGCFEYIDYSGRAAILHIHEAEPTRRRPEEKVRVVRFLRTFWLPAAARRHSAGSVRTSVLPSFHLQGHFGFRRR